MSNLSMITDLLGYAYHLEDDSPDEQHLKVEELINKLVERDRVLVEALRDITNNDYCDREEESIFVYNKAANTLLTIGERF